MGQFILLSGCEIRGKVLYYKGVTQKDRMTVTFSLTN